MPCARRGMERASRMPYLRPRRMLRGFRARSRPRAFQVDGPPDDLLARACRNVGVVLRPQALLRPHARQAAAAALRAGLAARPNSQAMIAPGIVPVGLAALALGTCTAAMAAEERANYFDDPFLQVTSAIADCPPQQEPLITQAEMRAQAHVRAER